MSKQVVLGNVAAMADKLFELEQQVAAARRHYLQTMLVLATMAGGELRIGAIDYAMVKPGTTLATFVDLKTGDRVFVAKEPDNDAAAI